MPSREISDSLERNLRKDLDLLEQKLEQLRLEYEQYFINVAPRIPEKLHKTVRSLDNQLINAPFKSAADKFRLASLHQRLSTYETYWERVLKQREQGTYSKDLFKAKIRTERAP